MGVQVEDELSVLTRYLIQREPTELSRELYAKLVGQSSFQWEKQDEKIWRRMIANPLLIPFVDGALGLWKPYSPIRKRIYATLTLLETIPEYHDYFLPQAQPKWIYARLTFFGLRAVVCCILGTLMLPFVTK